MFNINKMTIVAGAALLGLAASGPAMAYGRSVEVVNHTRVAVLSFFASNVGTDSWEEDILGADVLPPGYRVHVDLNNEGSRYCNFDLKARLADGSAVVRRNVDVCTNPTFTLFDR
jgi:hypothetical protein